jgi:hypothetical protein
MILKHYDNTVLAAPAFSNLGELLVKYRAFMQEEVLDMSDLMLFITKPSALRSVFLDQLEVQISTVDNIYVKQIYS